MIEYTLQLANWTHKGLNKIHKTYIRGINHIHDLNAVVWVRTCVHVHVHIYMYMYIRFIVIFRQELVIKSSQSYNKTADINGELTIRESDPSNLFNKYIQNSYHQQDMCHYHHTTSH